MQTLQQQDGLTHCLPHSRSTEACDEQGRRRKAREKGASVEMSEGVLMGEEITPESAHSSVQTHTHLPFTGFSLLF